MLNLMQRLNPAGNSTAKRLQRRRALTSFFSRHVSQLIIVLLLVGYSWLLSLPTPELGRGTYIDENALQPNQVNTYWGWGDVHAADRYLQQLEYLRDSNATSDQRARFLADEFSKLGLSAATQRYSYTSSSNPHGLNGTNAYAVLASPRSPRNEAMVISASWLSRTGEGDGTLNLRGISTVLALARFLKKYSLWAKDIVFVISDGYLDGMHAWLNTYHGNPLSNLEAQTLDLTSGVIWTALNIDYPGHSFSHLGLFFEGLNGRLPNQDLLNSVQRIARYTGQVPVIVYDHLGWHENTNGEGVHTFLPLTLQHHSGIREFIYRAKNIFRQLSYQARGKASGVHGLYHQFRIDAITVFAVPATGPHGFHALGRILESSLRTMNNLLERLHASFFLFILTAPDQFMKIGSYLPSVILISVALMFLGLKCWVDAGWKLDIDNKSADSNSVTTRSPRDRPVLRALGIMAISHLAGVAVFLTVTNSWYLSNQKLKASLVAVAISILSLPALILSRQCGQQYAPMWQVLKAMNLCWASTVISAITVLNFALAALLAISLGIPLMLSSPSSSKPATCLKYLLYSFLASGWLFLHEETRDAIWQWEILSVWFSPFICLVYTPIVLQAGIVCILPLS